jgi:hypothetical protein
MGSRSASEPQSLVQAGLIAALSLKAGAERQGTPSVLNQPAFNRGAGGCGAGQNVPNFPRRLESVSWPGAKATIVHYNAVRIVGSFVIGGFLAIPPTLLIYRASCDNNETLVLLLPLTILLIRSVLWVGDRSVKENSDAVRRRYGAGDPPLGE